MEPRDNPYALRGVLLIILGVLLMANCATTQATRQSASKAVSSAQAELQAAYDARAAKHAPQEYHRAKEAADRARSLLQQGNYNQASRVAEQAVVLAREAKAKAKTKKGTRR